MPFSSKFCVVLTGQFLPFFPSPELTTGFEANVENLQQQLVEREEELSQQRALCKSLELKNAELLQMPETKAATSEFTPGLGENLEGELEQTKAALADALAKLEDDDGVVVKWEGKLRSGLIISVAKAKIETNCDIFLNQNELQSSSQL